MINLLVKTKNAILDILFPPICLNCRKYLDNPDKFLCDGCHLSIKISSSLFCPVCKLRLAENKKICSHSPYLLAAAGNYDDPAIRNIIHYFKYESFENLALVLSEIILKYLNNLAGINIKNFIIVPIPLHHNREKRRGFNQSKLLADIIAEKFNIQMIDCLKRVKNTDPQAKLKNNDERIKNIAGCFKIKNSESVENKSILLIDDVFTTGATMNEAVKILKENGAKRIIALVAAKA